MLESVRELAALELAAAGDADVAARHRDAPREHAAAALPAGTVTFLMSDIEGSTRLFHRFGSAT